MSRGPNERRRRDRGEDETPDFLAADLDSLNRALAPYGLAFDDDASPRILRFASELLLWNDRLNLLSRQDVENVIRKHVAASMGVFLLAQPSPSDRWVDVGTGAGFPGLVLKIARPWLNLDLIDSARKRCVFLEEMARTLRLGRIPIMQARVETILSRKEGVGAYDVVTARAVASLADSATIFGPLVARGGRLITFKGPQWTEEVEQAKESGALSAAGFELETATRVPWSVGHVLSFRRSS